MTLYSPFVAHTAHDIDTGGVEKLAVRRDEDTDPHRVLVRSAAFFRGGHFARLRLRYLWIRSNFKVW